MQQMTNKVETNKGQSKCMEPILQIKLSYAAARVWGCGLVASVSDVCKWLESIGMPQHKSKVCVPSVPV